MKKRFMFLCFSLLLIGVFIFTSCSSTSAETTSLMQVTSTDLVILVGGSGTNWNNDYDTMYGLIYQLDEEVGVALYNVEKEGQHLRGEIKLEQPAEVGLKKITSECNCDEVYKVAVVVNKITEDGGKQ